MSNPTLYRIDLELAREPGHPDGDAEHNYRIYLPLTGDGHIDQASFGKFAALCRVVRKRPGEDEVGGRIARGPGGRWIFDYSDAGDRDDEIGFRLSEERFVPDEYVSIREDDGRLHTFRIVSVRPD